MSDSIQNYKNLQFSIQISNNLPYSLGILTTGEHKHLFYDGYVELKIYHSETGEILPFDNDMKHIADVIKTDDFKRLNAIATEIRNIFEKDKIHG